MSISDWWYTGANNAADKAGYMVPRGVGLMRKISYTAGWVLGYFGIVVY